MLKFKGPYDFDSDQDYYEYLQQVEDYYNSLNDREPDDPDEPEAEDRDCDYWASNCWGRG